MTGFRFPSPARLGFAAGALLIGLLLLAILVGLAWLPYDPIAIDLAHPLAAPSLAHPLGTDEFGRDVLSRAILGGRISVSIGLAVVAAAVGAGTCLGILAGYLGGWSDRLLMALIDVVLAFPGILLALALIAVLGAGSGSIVLALGIAYLPSVVRVVRGSVKSLREKEFVEASLVTGDSALYTMARHVLPNVAPAILILATSLFGWAVLSESALSFLGVGVPPPAPTWGNMLSSSRPYMAVAPWLGVVPGLCVAATLLGVNLLSEALRDRLDPRRES